MKKTALIGILTAAVLFLLTCSNNFSILEEIETEVMIAHDKFLEIESVNPKDDSRGVNPGTDIEIRLDRNIDVNKISDRNITISDQSNNEKAWLEPAQFNSSTKTLTVRTEGLNSQTKYIIKVSGLKGTDGSDLQEEYIWSFTTGNIPGGSISLASNNDNSLYGYTDSSTVTAVITGNDIASSYYIDNNSTVFSTPESIADDDWISPSFPVENNSYSISGTEGENIVYVMHRYHNGTEYVYGQLESAHIILDTDDPIIDTVLIDNDAQYSTDTVLSVALTITDEEPKKCRYSYTTTDNTTPSSYTALGASSVVFDADVNSEDGVDKSVNVIVMDPAGNVAGPSSDTITVDDEHPGAPTITTSTENTASSTLRWDWDDGYGNFNNFERRINDGNWYNLSNNYYEITLKNTDIGARMVIDVRAEDAAGNVSDYDSHSISYFPSTYDDLIPVNGATLVSRTTNFNWPDFLNSDGTYADGYYLYTSFLSDPVLVTNSYWKSTETLSASTTYYWRYEPFVTIGKRRVAIGLSPIYSFTTSLK